MPPLDPPLEPSDPADAHAPSWDPGETEFSEDEIELAYQRALAAFSDHETPDEFESDEPESAAVETAEGGAAEPGLIDADTAAPGADHWDTAESAIESELSVAAAHLAPMAHAPFVEDSPDLSPPGALAPHNRVQADLSDPNPVDPNAAEPDEWAITANPVHEVPAVGHVIASDDVAAEDLSSGDFANEDFAHEDFAGGADALEEDLAQRSVTGEYLPDDAAAELSNAEDALFEPSSVHTPEADAAADEFPFPDEEELLENLTAATSDELDDDLAADEVSATVHEAPGTLGDPGEFTSPVDFSAEELALDPHHDPQASELSAAEISVDSNAATVEDGASAELGAELEEDAFAAPLDDTPRDPLRWQSELAHGGDEGDDLELADELPDLALPDLTRLEAELADAGVELADSEESPEIHSPAGGEFDDGSHAPQPVTALAEDSVSDLGDGVVEAVASHASLADPPEAAEPDSVVGLGAIAVSALSADQPSSHSEGMKNPRGQRRPPGSVPSEPQVTWRGDASHGERGASLRGPRGVPSDRFAPPPPTSAETITPAQVIEGALFVGGGPLSAGKLYALLRGTIALDDVPELIDDLNQLYASQNRPYEIRLGDGGYVLDLCPEYEKLRHRVFGQGPREVRLTQDQLEVLALVAYRQPISEAGIAALGRPEAGHVLRQLLRRELVSLERGDQGPKDVSYSTTERFLSVFGLASLAELPQPEDLAAR